MDYETYHQTTQSVAALVDQGKFDDALAALRTLIESDLPDLDKSMMCVNMAVVYDKMGREADALKWYDCGIAFEEPYDRFFVAEKKAEFFAWKGRKAESLAIYEALEPAAFLTANDRERIRLNIAQLRK